MPSRSEYIRLIVSRLGLPSEYDYWLREYSLNIPQKSITTSPFIFTFTFTLESEEFEKFEKVGAAAAAGM